MKIGFPRALFYFEQFSFWAGFFKHLDIEVVTSPPTHRQIMEIGLKKASDETCLPLKLLAGHIQALKITNVDYVFLPRVVSIEANTYTCPKFLGIPESVLGAVPEGMAVLTVNLNWRKGRRGVLKELEVLGAQLGKHKSDVRKAFRAGLECQRKYLDSMGEEWKFEGTIKPSSVGLDPGQEPLRIALVGHSYLTQESYANLNLLTKLQEKVKVVLVQNVNSEDIETHLAGLRKKIFWSHSKEIFGASSKFMLDPRIDGIIYLTCFGCGTDSMIQELVSRKAGEKHKPYMVITLDEHSGEAGLVTRLEAFLDMVERRKAHEGYIPAYGKCLDRDSNAL